MWTTLEKFKLESTAMLWPENIFSCVSNLNNTKHLVSVHLGLPALRPTKNFGNLEEI